MLTGFKDKTLKTLVLEPIASRKTQISENLRSLGINEISVSGSVKESITNTTAILVAKGDSCEAVKLYKIPLADDVNPGELDLYQIFKSKTGLLENVAKSLSAATHRFRNSSAVATSDRRSR